MGYTLLNEDGIPQQIRLLGIDYGQTEKPIFKAPFTPKSWTCEPCNTPDKRYHIVFNTGIESYYPWYKVIVVGEYDANDEETKLRHAEKVEEAWAAVQKAQAEYNRLTK